MSAIRKFLGLGRGPASNADYCEAEADNALREVTQSTETAKAANRDLLESQRELRRVVNSFAPFVQAEQLLKKEQQREQQRTGMRR